MTSRVHPCRALRCALAVPVEKLMCKRHWQMVSRQLRREVAETWAPGWDGDAWMLLAITRAVNEVAVAEGEMTLEEALRREDQARRDAERIESKSKRRKGS